MVSDLIRYDLLVQEALRNVVRKVLTDTVKEGLRGDHHFFITFRTKAPGLRLSERMRTRYPEEMTIILQHQFWDLSVNDQAFEVGLSFGGVPERLLIPFDALTAFSDPAAEFGLKFEPRAEADDADKPTGTVTKLPSGAGPKLVPPEAEEPADPVPVKAKPAPKPKRDETAKSAAKISEKAADPAESDAKIVSIDAFRKK
jgi:hypothetical protein